MRDINSKHCKDICRLTGTKLIRYYIGMYDRGYRYCTRCAFYFSTKSIQCACCGMKLRSRPRHSNFRPEVKRI